MQSITRQKTGKKFTYYQGKQKISKQSEVERINKLAIPPAWNKVYISPSPNEKVQAQGYDKAGRLQYIYNAEFRLQQEQLKFERILRFAKALPKIRKQTEHDLKRKKLGKQKVLACIVSLIDAEYFRVGNEQYAKQNQHFGITTLRSKHLTTHTNTVTFDFVGKSGQEHSKTIANPKLARIIKQLDEMPGHEIFRYQDKQGTMHDLHSSDVNEYIHQHMGDEFTAKDFRTWGGTLLATTAILADEFDAGTTKTARKKAVTAVVKQVAKKLGNTPAIARKSYIDPRVFKVLDDQKALTKIKQAITSIRPKKYMSIDELRVLKLLS